MRCYRQQRLRNHRVLCKIYLHVELKLVCVGSETVQKVQKVQSIRNAFLSEMCCLCFNIDRTVRSILEMISVYMYVCMCACVLCVKKRYVFVHYLSIQTIRTMDPRCWPKADKFRTVFCVQLSVETFAYVHNRKL